MENDLPIVARILVVDDFPPFRHLLRHTIQEQTELLVIGEAEDGFEAVKLAAELLPDLVLLDIGMPNLNGFEAARRMRVAVPQLKILFVTQECFVDIVEEAFNLGARGYVVKVDAGRELLIAIRAVLRGDKFVSKSLIGPDIPGFKDG